MHHQLKPYLLLALTPHVGPVSFASLLRHFGDAETVFQASDQELRPYLERPNQAISAIRNRSAQAACDAALQWAQTENCRLMTLLDDDYPIRLAQDIIAPPLLFLRGNIQLLKQPLIAIVGSRKASPQGLRAAEELATALSAKNMTIVSGMASGIDAAAHQGALSQAGSTIAILGTGIDRVYPRHHHALAHRIATEGLLISEFPLGTTPHAVHFPRRNRIIAALSSTVIVAEAAKHSGSLITAHLALDLGREVMAIPGSIFNPQAAGCHYLIQHGAKLVTCVDDILEDIPAFNRPLNSKEKPTNSPTHSNKALDHSSQKKEDIPSHQSAAAKTPNATTCPLLAAMGFDAIHPDELAEKTGQHTADIQATLLSYELEGIVASTTGGRFQRLR